MAVMSDTPADLEKAIPSVGLVELAERDARTPPGVAGDDFRPWFAVLARRGYKGYLTIEASGTPGKLAAGIATIVRQANEV
jgi:sugar phosphate isomerase/epimerase